MGADLVITGWFLSPIIREMQDNALSYMRRQSSWKKDQEKDLERLDTILTEILAMVDAIEKREIKDANQKKLLRKLKDAIYSAVDVLDSFQYMVLKSKVDGQAAVSRVASSCAYLGKRLLGADKFRKKLSDMLERLDEVKTTADTLLKLVSFDNTTARLLPVIAQSRVTSSLVEENQTFGRREELDRIRGLLLEVNDGGEPESSDASVVHVISIVGVGGVGKTNLAQLAYKDELIRRNFSLRMWVCVSDTYDEMRLTRDILESATDENHRNVTNFDELQNVLRRKIDGKRFLLILDDVWYDEERTNWENELVWSRVFSPLMSGSRGSKILVTTRTETASNLLHARSSLPLMGLDRDEYWLLFKRCAFAGKYPGQFPELKEIGMQIAERLKGLPLAAKVIGRLLNADLDVRHWKKVLESDISDDVMKVLRLSYHHLPVHLQLCFNFCGLFPKDWRFDSRRLVDMWISQGFVQKEDAYDTDGNVEDTAKGYFNDLVQRSFFERSWLDTPLEYVMHDLINDLARNVSKDEYFRIESEKLKGIPPTVRHLSVSANFLGSLQQADELKNLRTLLVWRKSWPCWEVSLPDDVFKKFKCIRVLDLTGCCLEKLPASVKLLKHLRYLAFRVPEKPLPKSLINQLYHLEVLVTRGHSCRKSECFNLPANMKRNLLRLRKAYIFNVGGATIAGFGDQTLLHGPGEFHVKKESGHRLGELKEMRSIRGRVRIRFLEHVEHRQQAAEVCLDCKEHVKDLELEWSNLARASVCDLDSEVLDALRPHPDLEKLKVIGYRGTRSPAWFETNWLTALQFLNLESCMGWEVLPPLGQLPLLEYLEVRNMHAVRKLGQEFYGNGETRGFPRLLDVLFDGMPRWEEWSGIEGCLLLPCLQRLRISRCPKLREAPAFPSTPRVEVEMTSDSLPISSLMDTLAASAAQLILHVSSCSFLSGLHSDQLKHVKELNVKNCSGPMPRSGFLRLSSLEILRISNCPGLLASIDAEEVEDDGTAVLPPSLSCLEVADCNVQSDLLPRYLQGLICLSTLVINSCHSMASLTLALEPYHLSALKTVIIRGCHGLASLDGFGDLVALSKLVIAECHDFCSLPADLHRVTSLKTLAICGCPEMRSLPQDGLPASLQMILLSQCHPELDSQLQKKEGAEWHKIAHIPEKKLEVELIDLVTIFPTNSV